MEIVRAKLTKELIEDEQHPNPMRIAQLTERMREWLATDYICLRMKTQTFTRATVIMPT